MIIHRLLFKESLSNVCQRSAGLLYNCCMDDTVNTTGTKRLSAAGLRLAGLVCLAGLLLLAGCQTAAPAVPAEAAEPAAADTLAATITATLEALLPTEIEIVSVAGITDTPVVKPSITPPPPTATRIPPTQTYTPTVTIEPTETVRPKWPYPTRTPTNTATSTVTSTPTPPLARMHITKPGLYSKIISPYRMEAMVLPGADGLVSVRLVGEDGRLIINQLLDYSYNGSASVWIAPYLEFESSAAAELARLEVGTQDMFGRRISLSTVDLILMSVGKNQVNDSAILYEPYLIRYPDNEQVVAGGEVWVAGLADPVSSNPLVLELIDEAGNVLGSQEIPIAEPTGDLSHTPFGVGIPYVLEEDITPVRLILRQESDGRIPGTVALSSIELTLIP